MFKRFPRELYFILIGFLVIGSLLNPYTVRVHAEAPGGVTHPGLFGIQVGLFDASGNQIGGVASGAANTANPVVIGGVDGSGNARQLSTDSSGDLNVNPLALNKLLDSMAAQSSGQYQAQLTTAVSGNTTTVTYDNITLAGDTTDKGIFDARSAFVQIENNSTGTTPTITAVSLRFNDTIGSTSTTNTISSANTVNIATGTEGAALFCFDATSLLKTPSIQITETTASGGNVKTQFVLSSMPLSASNCLTYRQAVTVTDGTTAAGVDANSSSLKSGGATGTTAFSFTSPSTVTTAVETSQTGLGSYRTMACLATLQNATGGTLDIYLQTSDDGGTTWTDYAHFTQLASNTAASTKVYTFTKSQNATPVAVGSGTSPALAAGTFVGGDWGDRMRSVAVTGTGTTTGTAQVIKCTLTT